MNALHVTLSFSHGGRREAIAELCRGLAPLGVANHLCCLDALDTCDDELSGTFESWSELGRKSLFDRVAAGRLRAICRERAIDIVHAHDAASEAACAIALPRRVPPMLMTFHRSLNFESSRPRDRLRNALAGLRAGAIVTASDERRRHYLENNFVSAAKLLCIPLGIDLERFRPDPDRRAAKRAELGAGEETLVIGTIGHFGVEKGVDLAIGAFQSYRERHPDIDARLVILGAGNEQQERYVRGRVRREHAARIRFAGYQPAPEEWIPAFDLVLHGARTEAFGLVLAEAMACGVPIVANAVGGIPEIVDASCGVLSETADLASLAAALEQALAEPNWRRAAAEAALARARSAFGSELCARRYFALYSRLLQTEAA